MPNINIDGLTPDEFNLMYPTPSWINSFMERFPHFSSLPTEQQNSCSLSEMNIDFSGTLKSPNVKKSEMSLLESQRLLDTLVLPSDPAIPEFWDLVIFVTKGIYSTCRLSACINVTHNSSRDRNKKCMHFEKSGFDIGFDKTG